MRTTPRTLLAVAALLAGPAARADVIEATSTTMVTAGQQTVGAPPGQTPELQTVVPAYEILTLSAREVRNPLFENLEVVVAGWASLDLQEVRWNAGTTDTFTGDLQTGYVRGQLLGRALTLRAGRAFVTAGAGRMLQIDGGDLLVRVPAGPVSFSLSGFGGLPVAQRFSTRSGTRSWNPAGGDLAYGGRLALTAPFAGPFGRGLELGASAVFVEDAGEPVREDVGVDLRLQPVGQLLVTGHAVWSLAEGFGRVADASLAVSGNLTRDLFGTADLRLTSPDLFLSRASILSVFADTSRTAVGGGLRYRLHPDLSVGVDYHALLEPAEDGVTDSAGVVQPGLESSVGHEAALRGEWEHGPTRAGAEVSYLDVEKNGYTGARIWGRRELGRAFVVGDVMAYFLREEVNGESVSLQGVLSAGYDLGGGWSAVLAGRAGVTPFLEQQGDVMVKLAYNLTTRVREVR